MTEATQTFRTWWDVMVGMMTKYGTSPDIEEKPEWGTLQQVQGELLRKLQLLTGAPQEVLFENLQKAMFHILGVDGQIVLTSLQAQKIIHVAVQLTVADECYQRYPSKMVN